MGSDDEAFSIPDFCTVSFGLSAAGASHLVFIHGLVNLVTGPVVHNLQPLVNGGLKPVMVAC